MTHKYMNYKGVQENIVGLRICEFCTLSLANYWLFRKWPAIGSDCTHCVENLEDLFQRYVGEGWVDVDNWENTIFPFGIYNFP